MASLGHSELMLSAMISSSTEAMCLRDQHRGGNVAEQGTKLLAFHSLSYTQHHTYHHNKKIIIQNMYLINLTGLINFTIQKKIWLKLKHLKPILHSQRSATNIKAEDIFTSILATWQVWPLK